MKIVVSIGRILLVHNQRIYHHIMGLAGGQAFGKTGDILCEHVDKLTADLLMRELYPTGFTPEWYAKFEGDVVTRFYEKIGAQDDLTGCVEWLGAHDLNHYGKFAVGLTTHPAHQIALLEIGKLPPDEAQHYEAHHICQVPGCVNPYHCEWVTRTEHKNRHRELDSLRTPVGP